MSDRHEKGIYTINAEAVLYKEKAHSTEGRRTTQGFSNTGYCDWNPPIEVSQLDEST